MSMTPQQCRMARAALGWSVQELGERAGVRPNTVSSFERGGASYRSTAAALQAALESAGAIFIGDGEASDGGGPGVRVMQPSDP